jgi:hypothetical protein
VLQIPYLSISTTNKIYYLIKPYKDVFFKINPLMLNILRPIKRKIFQCNQANYFHQQKRYMEQEAKTGSFTETVSHKNLVASIAEVENIIRKNSGTFRDNFEKELAPSPSNSPSKNPSENPQNAISDVLAKALPRKRKSRHETEYTVEELLKTYAELKKQEKSFSESKPPTSAEYFPPKPSGDYTKNIRDGLLGVTEKYHKKEYGLYYGIPKKTRDIMAKENRNMSRGLPINESRAKLKNLANSITQSEKALEFFDIFN